MSVIPITGFTPSVNPVVGDKVTIIDCSNLVPTNKGLKTVKAGEKITTSPVPGTLLKGFVQTILDGSERTLACTTTAIYELLAGAWSNISRVGGYTTPVGNTWRMCQFGDVTIATNGNNPIQASTTTGAFTDLDGNPPKAKICEVTQGFVLLFDFDDGVDVVHDGWWASGVYDHTQWTPGSGSTLATNGRLFDTPGAIIGAKRMANSIVAYKEESMYFGEFVGGDIVWQWRQLSDTVGAYSHESIVNAEAAHYFLGKNGLFRYDGSRLEPLGLVEIKDWLRDNINIIFKSNIKGFYDSKNSLIYWFYVSNSSQGACDEALVYHLPTGEFGRITRQVNSLVDYTPPNLTWGEVGSLYPIWGSWPIDSAWNSSVFYSTNVGFSYFGLDGHIYKVEGGLPLSSSITTGDIGDDSTNSILNRVRARFFKQPLSASMKYYRKQNEGEDLMEDGFYNMYDSKFDLTRSSRFHRLKLNFNGETEITALDINLVSDGER
jgi:hypothetical protein